MMIEEIVEKLKELKVELEYTILIDSYNTKSKNINIIQCEIQGYEKELIRRSKLNEALS